MLDQAAKGFIENFYCENYQNLYLHARSKLKHEAEIEAALQEAFLVACKKPEEFMASENPIRWMEKTITYVAMHILRERKKTAALFLPFEALAPGQEPSTLDGGSFELIAFCQSVVTKEHLAFFLRIAEGSSSFVEEAERMGIGLHACYKRFERIREKLQRALDEFHKSGREFSAIMPKRKNLSVGMSKKASPVEFKL